MTVRADGSIVVAPHRNSGIPLQSIPSSRLILSSSRSHPVHPVRPVPQLQSSRPSVHPDGQRRSSCLRTL